MLKKAAMVAFALFAACSVLAAQNTGGDKGRRFRASSVRNARGAQPPDPLVSHKSPGRNKRLRRHHRHAGQGVKPDAFTVKQKSNRKTGRPN